jgi:hypothetical protein
LDPAVRAESAVPIINLVQHVKHACENDPLGRNRFLPHKAIRICVSPEITQAIEQIKTDSNLATERTIKTLRWRDSTPPAPSRPPAWLTWIAGFFRWIGESARVVVWGAAIVMAGLLVVFIGRLLHRYRAALPEARFIAPTHVRDLDIRPESLPEDIGRAARVLWDNGEDRAALALLYRGLLSRLAHVHHIPVRDSSTEGDCLALAARHLPQGPGEYASELVRVWQRAVYGREAIPSLTVHVLCDEFAPAMNSAAPLDAIKGAV